MAIAQRVIDEKGTDCQRAIYSAQIIILDVIDKIC